MKKLLAVCLLQSALSSALVWAKPYQAQNPINDVLIHQSVDFEKIGHAITVLQQHAGDYPVQFDNDEDRKKAIEDNKQIATIFHTLNDSLDPNDPANLPLFLMKARNAWIAHNLDIEGGKESAAQTYLIAIQLAAGEEKIILNEELGRFLSGANLLTEGEKYLRLAYEKRPQSALPLALNLVAQQRVDEGLPLLREFIAQNPEHERAKQMLQAIEQGNLKFNH